MGRSKSILPFTLGKRFDFIAALIIAVLVGPALLPAAHIRGKIVRVGFSGSGASSGDSGIDFFRSGAWTPVLIELNNTDGDLFEGAIQVAQRDRDGDYATSTVPITVREMRNYYVYVPAGSSDTPFKARILLPNGSHVRLYNDLDQPVHELRPVNDPQAVPANAEVILDISTPPVNLLNKLVHDPLLARELFVTRIGSAQLPDQVTGIEWVDTIVWDDPEPSTLDLPQRDALIEWVHRGGTLVLGVGKNWQSVSRSQLAPLLPATLNNAVSGSEIPELAEILTGLTSRLEPPLTYCPVTQQTLAPDSICILPALPAELKPDSEMFVISRPHGRGRVVLVTAEMNELLARGTSGHNLIFLRQVLGLNQQAEKREDNIWAPDLFEYIESSTGFTVTSSLYLLFACMFVVAYIAIASGGSWVWLKRRNRVHYAWPAFAVIAMAASGTSLAAVQIIRGIGHQVQQFSIVDARAGSRNATSTSYFGLKTASHQLLDLTISKDSKAANDALPMVGGLCPMASEENSWGGEETYSAGRPYEVFSSLGQLRSVPMRATLKQFRGTWHGELSGQLNAHLKRRDSSSYKLLPDSWIDNQLGVDLENCYLFVALRNPVSKAEGQRSREMSIEVYPISRIPVGKKVSWKELAAQQPTKPPQSGELAEDKTSDWKPYLLDELQTRWLKAMNIQRDLPGNSEKPQISQPQMVNALLIATTWGDLKVTNLRDNGLLKIGRALELDCSANLTQATALLVGFTEKDAGPARLCWRESGTSTGGWRAINPVQARVMYRFAIPVESP